MKLKKLFAGVVAVAMMATMAFPAFAARTPSTYATNGDSKIAVSEDGTFTIKKAYASNNGATAPKENFTLTATKESVSKSSISDTEFKAAGAYELTIHDATFENGDITDFNVKLPNYGKPGVFVYKLHENDNGTAGVTYDNNDYYLTVYAFNKADSTAKVEANDLQYAVRLDRGLQGNENFEKKVDTINNSYTAEPLTITKTVNGNMGDRTQPFEFKVVFNADKIVKSSISVSGDHGEVTGVALDDNNTFTFTNTATVNFTLTHGQTMNFLNLPEGVTYKVEEVNVPAGYKTYINGADTTATATEGTIGNTAVTIGYENVNGDTTIDTGVILDNAPYILMLAVVAAGAMTLVIKKRREEE